jgi:DNA polymerase-3 subunit chi
MTQIDFYVQVDDRQETARKLCGKALGASAKLVIWCADQNAGQRLSRLLWSIPATGFLPHCFAADPLAPRTPILLAWEDGAFAHDDILINLRDEVPAFFSRFERLIEIVSTDEADKRSARDRFRYYRDRGYEIRTHDMTGNGNGNGAGARRQPSSIA